jgi:hypothetical protein
MMIPPFLLISLLMSDAPAGCRTAELLAPVQLQTKSPLHFANPSLSHDAPRPPKNAGKLATTSELPSGRHHR